MNAFDGLQKNGKKLNKNVAKNIAEQIGLNVVPKGKDAKKPKVATPEPTIKWSEEVKEFFWGERGDDDGVEQVENEEGFPLLVLKDVLDEASLEKALKMANDALDDAEEIEQHELLNNKPQTLRRSMVAQLSPSSELLTLLQESLPEELTECPEHPYEDASVVGYRNKEGDFYGLHHDSYSPFDPPRTHHRAFTILVYLRTPPGGPSLGGTEFSNLTLPLGEEKALFSDGIQLLRADGGRGLSVKVKPGSALAWPNFKPDGKPDAQSYHRALPLNGGTGEGKAGEENVGKVVVNLWFEGLKKGKRTKLLVGAPKLNLKSGKGDRALFPEYDDSDKGTDGFSDGTSKVKGFG